MCHNCYMVGAGKKYQHMDSSYCSFLQVVPLDDVQEYTAIMKLLELIIEKLHDSFRKSLFFQSHSLNCISYAEFLCNQTIFQFSVISCSLHSFKIGDMLFPRGLALSTYYLSLFCYLFLKRLLCEQLKTNPG